MNARSLAMTMTIPHLRARANALLSLGRMRQSERTIPYSALFRIKLSPLSRRRERERAGRKARQIAIPATRQSEEERAKALWTASATVPGERVGLGGIARVEWEWEREERNDRGRSFGERGGAFGWTTTFAKERFAGLLFYCFFFLCSYILNIYI